jgi:hypothetical protein
MRNDRVVAVTLLLFALAGCSSTPPKKNPEPVDPGSVSSVEINYVRGHNEHRLIATLKGEAAVAQTFLDRQVLAESTIDPGKYMGFLHQAAEFLKVPRRSPDHFPCRTPFTVTVRIGTDTQVTSGCLGADEGALSHLVRDGEFLLHQGKGTLH